MMRRTTREMIQDFRTRPTGKLKRGHKRRIEAAAEMREDRLIYGPQPSLHQLEAKIANAIKAFYRKDNMKDGSLHAKEFLKTGRLPYEFVVRLEEQHPSSPWRDEDIVKLKEVAKLPACQLATIPRLMPFGREWIGLTAAGLTLHAMKMA